MSGEEEGFLSRWSRRKREAAVIDPPLEAPVEPAVELPTEAEALEASRSETPRAAPERAACPIPNMPAIDLESLPRIEDLTAESDFSLFLRPGIPSLLRNAALRRMWSLDPAIRDYIGPVDYQWDFNTPGGLPFGFSNELGGDVGKLLAQAIGKIEEWAEKAEGTEEAGPAGEAVAEGPAGPEGPVAEGLPPCLPEPPVAVRLGPIPDQPAVSVAAPPVEPGDKPLPRRRHGGALPA
jgi:hypothetical protein